MQKKIIVTSDNPRSENIDTIIEDIILGINNKKALRVEPCRQKAIEIALEIREKDEIVIVLGKGDETFQEIGGKKIPFDDREVIKKLLG